MLPEQSASWCIRPLTTDHLGQMVAIEKLSYAHPWDRRLFEAELLFPNALNLGVFAADSMLRGFLFIWLVLDEAQVQNIAIHPAYRQRGAARMLLEYGLAEASRQGATWASLEVRPSNLAARRLYEQLGFALVGRRPNYYQAPPEDALLLNCRLADV